MRCIDPKWSNVMMCIEPNEKLENYVIKLCGRSYMYTSIIEIDHFFSCELCMSWLNWSLKLHIRLRIISSLIPTHITYVYVQWMPYSFVWLYLFKCVAHTQLYVDQTQIFFFECFNCFWKVFLFWKFSKISKTVQLCFGDLLSWVNLVTSLLRSFRESLAS